MDLEASTLVLLTENSSFKKAWNLGIKPELFESPLNKQAYQFVQEYWFTSGMEKAPTREALLTEFPALDMSTVVDESIEWLVDKLKDRFVVNNVQNGIRDIATSLGAGDIKQSLKTMSEISWTAMQTISPRIGRSDLSENIMARRERYATRRDNPNLVHGVPLGLPRIDEHTMGLLPGEIALIAGFAKAGKTHSLIHTFIAARRSGYRPILFSLELSVAEIEDRMDSHMSGVSYERYQRGQLTHAEVESLLDAQDEFATFGPSYVEKPPEGERTVRHMLSRGRELGCDVVIIDQLSFIESRRDYRETKDQIKEIIVELKTNISENEANMLACFVAVQFNREVKKKAIPGMENLALSSSLEQTVDMIYGLRQSREMRANHSMVMDILGARRVPPLSYLLHWEFGDRTLIEVRDVFED